jgi:hypothetical protein
MAWHVFFPPDSFISLSRPIAARLGLEIGLIADEGMLRISLMLGISTAPLHGLVQGTRSAWRREAAAFCRELKHRPRLQQHLSRYPYTAEVTDSCAEGQEIGLAPPKYLIFVPRCRSPARDRRRRAR